MKLSACMFASFPCCGALRPAAGVLFLADWDATTGGVGVRLAKIRG